MNLKNFMGDMIENNLNTLKSKMQNMQVAKMMKRISLKL